MESDRSPEESAAASSSRIIGDRRGGAVGAFLVAPNPTYAFGVNNGSALGTHLSLARPTGRSGSSPPAPLSIVSSRISSSPPEPTFGSKGASEAVAQTDAQSSATIRSIRAPREEDLSRLTLGSIVPASANTSRNPHHHHHHHQHHQNQQSSLPFRRRQESSALSIGPTVVAPASSPLVHSPSSLSSPYERSIAQRVELDLLDDKNAKAVLKQLASSPPASIPSDGARRDSLVRFWIKFAMVTVLVLCAATFGWMSYAGLSTLPAREIDSKTIAVPPRIAAPSRPSQSLSVAREDVPEFRKPAKRSASTDPQCGFGTHALQGTRGLCAPNETQLFERIGESISACKTPDSIEHAVCGDYSFDPLNAGRSLFDDFLRDYASAWSEQLFYDGSPSRDDEFGSVLLDRIRSSCRSEAGATASFGSIRTKLASEAKNARDWADLSRVMGSAAAHDISIGIQIGRAPDPRAGRGSPTLLVVVPGEDIIRGAANFTHIDPSFPDEDSEAFETVRKSLEKILPNRPPWHVSSDRPEEFDRDDGESTESFVEYVLGGEFERDELVSASSPDSDRSHMASAGLESLDWNAFLSGYGMEADLDAKSLSGMDWWVRGRRKFFDRLNPLSQWAPLATWKRYLVTCISLDASRRSRYHPLEASPWPEARVLSPRHIYSTKRHPFSREACHDHSTREFNLIAGHHLVQELRAQMGPLEAGGPSQLYLRRLFEQIVEAFVSASRESPDLDAREKERIERKLASMAFVPGDPLGSQSSRAMRSLSTVASRGNLSYADLVVESRRIARASKIAPDGDEWIERFASENDMLVPSVYYQRAWNALVVHPLALAPVLYRTPDRVASQEPFAMVDSYGRLGWQMAREIYRAIDPSLGTHYDERGAIHRDWIYSAETAPSHRAEDADFASEKFALCVVFRVLCSHVGGGNGSCHSLDRSDSDWLRRLFVDAALARCRAPLSHSPGKSPLDEAAAWSGPIYRVAFECHSGVRTAAEALDCWRTLDRHQNGTASPSP